MGDGGVELRQNSGSCIMALTVAYAAAQNVCTVQYSTVVDSAQMQESGTRPASLLTIPISIIATGCGARHHRAKCLTKHGEACKISCWCDLFQLRVAASDGSAAFQDPG
jgi:hypothetical protein